MYLNIKKKKKHRLTFIGISKKQRSIMNKRRESLNPDFMDLNSSVISSFVMLNRLLNLSLHQLPHL